MRKLCIFALSLSAAVFAAAYLLPEQLFVPAGLLCALAGAVCVPLLRGDRRLRALLIAFGLSAGLLWTAGYSALFYAPAEALDGQTVPFSATVTDYPRPTSYGVSLSVKLDEGPGIKAVLYAEEKYQTLTPGDQISGTASLRLADTLYGQENSYYTARGVYLTGSAQGELTVSSPEVVPLSLWPVITSKALKDSISAVFPPDTAPLVIALITGDKDGLDDTLYTAFQRSGIAHVVAVSGLHVSFLSGLLTTLLRGKRRFSALVCIALLFFFAAVAGGTPSVLRAVFLQCFLLLAPLFGRENDRATSLSAALMILLIANPFAAASISLQLSFASVAGIYLVTGPLNARWMARLPKRPASLPGRLGRKAAVFLIGTLATTLGALIFTTPLTACYFNSLSLISPLTNLLTLWAVSDLFLGGLAAAVLGLILPVPASLAAQVIALLGRYLEAVARALSALPFAAVTADTPYLKLWLLAVYVLLILWLCLRRRLGGGRPLIPICTCAALLCIALLCGSAERSAGLLTVSVLDVGQGQSILLRSGNSLALVDCGGSGAQNAGDTAADAVGQLGRTKLDLLILTHCHADHAGGVPALLERLEVDTLVLPDVEPEDPLRQEILALAREKGTEVVLLTEDSTAQLGEASLRLYAPLGSGDTNEEGLAVLCTAGSFDMLITGDMDQTIEKRLIKYGDLPDIELLVAGHHGSKYAVSEELLLATEPEYAVISVGYNSYGHPAPETLERLGAADCAIYRTDLMGTVTFTIQN